MASLGVSVSSEPKCQSTRIRGADAAAGLPLVWALASREMLEACGGV